MTSILLMLTSTLFMKMLKTNLLNSMLILMISSMLLLISKMSNHFLMMTSSMSMDSLSLMFIYLTMISVILIILSSNHLNSISMTMIPILLILLITFTSKTLFMFYIFFEVVLIPTMILITINGKQPERLQASIYLIIYTITASLPLLISIIYLKMNSSFLFLNIMLTNFNMMMFLMLAFLVKMPMYFTHLWLPKAHVEAPLEGSMILAAVLLKLGGYGIIRFLPLCISSIHKMNFWIISISLLGATATSMNCIRQKDLKSLIAYSSVAHMGFVLTGLFTMNSIGMTGAIMMMIAHGLASSALFLLVNDIYIKYHTRNILMFKGMWTIMPNMTFWWFMFMSMNISAPPTINTLSEIMLMSNMFSWNNSTMIMIFIMSLMTTSFSLMMFINIIHNKNKMMPSMKTPQKIYLSLFIHFMPPILMIMKPEIMNYYNSSLMKTMVCGTTISIINMTSSIILTMSMIFMAFSMLQIKENTFMFMKISLSNMFSMSFPIDIMLDWTSTMFISTVMMISSLIIMFSTYYIPKNEHKQFMLLLMMFVLSMTILILSNNIFLILLGWDGLGLSSYILVVYYQNFSSSSSGTITLLSNRIGDIMILMSIGLITISSNWNFNMNSEYSTISMLLLMTAACSKSAQFPFSAWLPMAMAAPTPISALVHSSTLVTAGVFLMLRISQTLHPYTSALLMSISSLTAIYASMSANWEQDLKKIIALSTLSQIAMMMFAISLNSLMLAYSHLIIHALFKSAMFLCAGTMIHETSYQDMRMMGMNFLNLPLTLTLLGVNSLALMGIPFMSGFFSKDMILESMMYSNMNTYLYVMMIMSIGMTASYTIRLSLHSNKSYLKMNSIQSNHLSIHSMLPIILLSLMAITSGSWITWILSPTQMFLISYNNKMLIMSSLILGLILGFSLQFKNKTFLKMGSSSISLWFTHFLTVIPINNLSPLMLLYHNMDKQWKENYGPNKMYKTMYMSTMLPESLKSSPLMILILISMLPTFIL